ncbi:hypothetical protein L208DRAFT_43628 [Tricholoma matsutake]|nr:hypothetical protein L208DRAFT_43628 [Tricholoma matsutake 945]
MACLNKLAIRGIRSFDDKQISVIEFFSPVTVIVGHNGSGKTTIIECLKYATTGDQPPNTRGGAFVHDPKMANEKEVKAQTSGLTMKTLESILALADGNADKGGKRGVISTKCAEMDSEIPQLLGVSKAVLENVIFCHQEDSYWPLAEPAALKKKFDDIFEATRYTKALDSIKNLRKDRVAELKAEKERLIGLSREKAHADKLKSRIADLTSTIAEKEVSYEETKNQYEAIVEANQKFYDYASKFRELYIKVDGLQKEKARLQADLDEAKLNLQEVSDTDEELHMRLTHFDDHINAQKQKKRAEDTKKQDLEDELVNVRKQHTQLVAVHGGLVAEAEAQKQRIAEREQLIHDISEKYGIKGFSHSPLEREKGDLRTKTEEYNSKSRQLHNELEGHKLQKKNLRDQIAQRQSSIVEAERKVENQQSLTSQLKTLQGDIEEKRSRLTKVKTDVGAAKYDALLADRTEKAKDLEERRDALNRDLRALSLQADARAKLDLKRGEVKSKNGEIRSILEITNVKLRKLAPERNVTVETIEREADRILDEKERESAELDNLATTANNALQMADTMLTNLKTQIKDKKEELRALERKLKDAFDEDSLEAAIKEATRELNHRKTLGGSLAGGSAVYESLLRVGKQKKLCTACNRHLNDQELVVFEKYLQELMKKASPAAIADNKREMGQWEAELERLQKLMPVQASRDQIKLKELPALEKQLKEQEASYPDISHQAEELTI